MVEDGDILEFDGEHYIVYKTSFLETVLLNVASNHRTRIRNSNLSDIKIDNLTKLAHSQVPSRDNYLQNRLSQFKHTGLSPT